MPLERIVPDEPLPFDRMPDDLVALRLPYGEDAAPIKMIAPSEPSGLDVIGASARRSNWIVSMIASGNPQYKPEPGYTPLSDIQGTRYLDQYADQFVGSQSSAETRGIIAHINEAETRDHVIQSGGWLGTVASFGAGMVDPIMLAPGGAIYRGYKLGALARSAAEGAAAGLAASSAQEGLLHLSQPERTMEESLWGVGSATILSGLLGAGASRLMTSVERRASVNAFDNLKGELKSSVAPTATIYQFPKPDFSVKPGSYKGPDIPALQIGGKLFTGETHADALETAIRQFGADSPEIKAFNDAENPLSNIGILTQKRGFRAGVSGDNGRGILEAAQEAIDTAPVREQSAPSLAASAGAAASDTRAVRPASMMGTVGKVYGAGTDIVGSALEKIPYGGKYASKAVTGLLRLPETLIERSGPLTRNLYSDFIEARRATADLAEVPILLEGNKVGESTVSGGGPAVETAARMAARGGRWRMQEAMDRLWNDYYWGNEKAKFAKIRAKVAELTGHAPEGRLGFEDFKDQVGHALRNGDQHQVSQVAQASQFLRKTIFDRWKEAAIQAKLLPEDVDPQTADSYLMRVYDRDKIVADRPGFHNTIFNWLKGDQAEKANLQSQIADQWNALRRARIEGKKVEGRVATSEKRLNDIESRLSEREQETSAALKRSGTVEARNQEAKAATKELLDFIKEMKDRGANRPEINDQIRQMESELRSIEKGSQLVNDKDLEAIDKAERQGILTGNMRRVARVVTGKANPPKPPSFWKWVADQGGIKVSLANVDPKSAPGLSRLSGMSMDRLQEKLAGEFPELRAQGYGSQEGRQAESFADEIVNAIEDSVSGREPEWFLAEKWNEDDRFVAEWSEMLDRARHDAGVEFKTIKDVADFFRGEHPGMTEADYDAIVESVQSGSAAPVVRAEGEALGEKIAIRQGSLTLFKDALTKAKTSLGKAETKAKVSGARAQEAGVAENRNLGRLGILNERSRIADRQREFLDAMRGHAADAEEAARTKIEELITQWEGKSAQGAQSALKARAGAESSRNIKQFAQGTAKDNKRLGSADAQVDSAVRRILNSERDKSDPELRSLTDEIIGRVLGTPDGRLPYDAPSGGPKLGPPREGSAARGPLAHRVFMIPDNLIAPWLVNDAERVANMYLHSIVPDVLLTQKFGDVDMTEAFKKLRDENSAKQKAAGSAAERTKINKQYERAVTDLAAMRDRIRHVYGHTENAALRNAGRIAQSLGAFNTLADMGGSAISQLSDIANPIFRHGFMNVFRDGWLPFLRSLNEPLEQSGFKAAESQYRAMGIGAEMEMDMRPMAEIGEEYHPRTKAERTLKAVANGYMVANFSAPMTAKAKSIAAVVVGNEILRATKAAGEGRATARQIRQLGESSITPELAERIAKSFEAGGAVKDGVFLPNTADWVDEGARLAFEGAVSREVEIDVVTPGQERALWMSHPVGRLLGQFKAFTGSSTTRILLANLQRRDAATVQGLIAAVAMGMVSAKAYSVASGRDTSKMRPQDWVKEGISRSGVIGWFDEENAFLSKATGGKFDAYKLIGADKELSRYASRSAIGQLLGPTLNKAENVLGAMRAISTGQISQPDVHAFRRTLPFQNLFYLRRLFDEIEQKSGEQLGIPKRKAVAK